MDNHNTTSLSSVGYWKSTTIASEINFKAVLSGGKGGQNVNKVSTKVELYWIPLNSYTLTDEQKMRVLQKLEAKLSSEGQLRIIAEEARGQLSNKTLALEKFYRLLASCFAIQKARRPTRPTRTSIAKRLTSKAFKKDVKAGRKRPNGLEEDM